MSAPGTTYNIAGTTDISVRSGHPLWRLRDVRADSGKPLDAALLALDLSGDHLEVISQAGNSPSPFFDVIALGFAFDFASIGLNVGHSRLQLLGC